MTDTNWDNVPDPFEVLGVSYEEVAEHVRELESRSRRDRDSRICECGHSMMAHRMVEELGREVCRPGRVICNCVEKEAVLRPEDARPFIRSTEGPFEKHALMIGLSRLKEKGLKAEWIKQPVCYVCGSAGAFPVPLNEQGQVVYGRSGTRNKFLCQTHYDVTRSGHIGDAIRQYRAQTSGGF